MFIAGVAEWREVEEYGERDEANMECEERYEGVPGVVGGGEFFSFSAELFLSAGLRALLRYSDRLI